MMEKTSNNWAAMSDGAIIATIDEYINEQRLQKNISQEKLAKNAGVNRSTVSQIENGEAITLLSLIQILRILNLLHLFDVFVTHQQISPIELAKLDKQKRQRVSSKKDKEQPESDW